MKKPVLIAILFVVAILALIVYSTMSLAAHRVEVCVQFNGHPACRTASGATQEFALRTAIQNACSEIASGVTDSMACERSTPSKVTWLK